MGEEIPLPLLEVSVKGLDEKVQEYAHRAKLSSKELSTILANKTAVELYMSFHKGDEKSQELWENACLFGMYSNTYKFNEARKGSEYEDAIEFFDNDWNKEIKLCGRSANITLKMLDLVNVCESNEYLDKKCKADAKAFLQAAFDDDDFACLLDVVKDNPNVDIEQHNTVHDDLFSEIISADELRTQLCEKIIAKEYEIACDKIFSTFDTQVFKGCAYCTFVSHEVSRTVVESLKEKLEALHLLVTIQYKEDTVEYSVRPEPTNGDFTGDYSEEALHRLLGTRDGGAYFFVQSYCDKVYLPKFIKKIVNDVATELRRVVQEGSTVEESVHIRKRKTSTDAYATLFNILKEKGFKVNEYENEYEVRWAEEKKA